MIIAHLFTWLCHHHHHMCHARHILRCINPGGPIALARR